MDAFIIHAKSSFCSACLDLFRDWLVSVENNFPTPPISVNQKQLDSMEVILEDRSNENKYSILRIRGEILDEIIILL